MDVAAFLNEIRSAGGYAGQIVHVHDVNGRPAQFGEMGGSDVSGGSSMVWTVVSPRQRSASRNRIGHEGP